MVTSRMSYNLHCDIGRPREMAPKFNVDDSDIPTLYVAVATWIPKCNMFDVESDVVEKNDKEIEATISEETKASQPEDVIMQSPPKETTEKTNNASPYKENSNKSPSKITPEKPDIKNSKPKEKESPKDENKRNEEKTDVVTVDSSDAEMENQSLNTSQITDLDDSVVIDPNITPNKNIKDLKTEKSSSKKKNPDNRLTKEERERKRLEEKEEKERLKREKLEQKIKERQEKEEQKRKEREEKEEQKRKEKEEKEEQKRKEKEEKEEQKRKEREEKEEQKRKEKEEKEAQKIKEREEKEEQKRKEKEEKDIKKQQELEKEKKKMEKESALFLNFFARKSTGNLENKKSEEVVCNFMPFQIKAGMRLAPSTRRTLTEEQKEILISKIMEQNQNKNLFLEEVKSRPLGKSTKTWPVEDDEVQILDDTGIGECLEEQKVEKQKMRAKYLLFHENKRPAYHGTWRKKSKNIRPRNPFGEDKEIFDYEVDSDDDWEEEEPGESLHGSDDEKENDSDEYEVDNEFFVPHGYLSDEEMEKENEEKDDQVNPETQQEKLKLLQIEFEEEMKSKTERIKPRLIGCIWESKLKPKIQDAISSFLEDRMMIISAPIVIKKREINKENINSTTKTSTPSRKQLSKELIPEFLKMIHGNTNNKIYLVNEFLNYLSTNHKEITVSKAGLTYQMKELATWKKCPDEGVMFNKNCWYVEPEIRKQYNLNVNLPNKWGLSEESSNAKKKLSL